MFHASILQSFLKGIPKKNHKTNSNNCCIFIIHGSPIPIYLGRTPSGIQSKNESNLILRYIIVKHPAYHTDGHSSCSMNLGNSLYPWNSSQDHHLLTKYNLTIFLCHQRDNRTNRTATSNFMSYSVTYHCLICVVCGDRGGMK